MCYRVVGISERASQSEHLWRFQYWWILIVKHFESAQSIAFFAQKKQQFVKEELELSGHNGNKRRRRLEN